MEPFHFLANMMDPKYQGKRLSADQEKMAEEWVQLKKPEFLPFIYKFNLKDANTFSPRLFEENIIKSLSSSDWWRLMEQKINKIKDNQLPKNFCSFFYKLLDCPASSASIERIFSTYGLIWSKLRNRLGIEKATKLVRIYKNLRSETEFDW